MRCLPPSRVFAARRSYFEPAEQYRRGGDRPPVTGGLNKEMVYPLSASRLRPCNHGHGRPVRSQGPVDELGKPEARADYDIKKYLYINWLRHFVGKKFVTPRLRQR